MPFSVSTRDHGTGGMVLWDPGTSMNLQSPPFPAHNTTACSKGTISSFNAAAETALRFTLPGSQPVSLRIYSVTGQLVRTLVDATLPPGDHSAMFRADDLPSGAYFAVLRAGQVQMSRTLMLVR